MPFSSYAAAGFTSELLPILPPDAEINPKSPSHDELLLSRGKVPGKRSREGWFGFANWSVHEASTENCASWSKWRSGIGMQGRKYPAIDIDVDDGGLADAIESEALLALGLAPARSGRAGRRLLVYGGAGIKKRRLAFRVPGRAAKPATGQLLRDAELPETGRDLGELAAGPAEGEPLFVVEILGDGQQYVVEGIHPKTLKPYAWRDGTSPAEIGADNLTPITAEEVDQFLANIAWLIEEIYDGEIVRFEQGAAGADRNGVWQDGLLAPSLAAVEEALAAIDNDLDYDDWFKVAVAVKAATGGTAEGFALFADWSASSGKDTPETTEIKYGSIRAPYSVGWDFLSRFASSRGDFSSAEHEFEAVEDAGGGASASIPVARGAADSCDNMFARYAWVEGAQRAVAFDTGDLLNQEQFEFRVPPLIIETPPKTEGGKPTRTKTSSWSVFKDNPKHRKSYKNLTFRPGGGLEVEENLPDLEGLCLNIWREPRRLFADTASDADVAPWLELAGKVIPSAAERNHVFDFMAWTVQHPGEKIHHALVLGSRMEGVGKDTLIEPLRAAVGRKYVREIGPQQLAGTFNAWVVGAKLAIVQEMHNFERRETMNRLKPFVAAPPLALPVNMKHRQEFFVPNLLSMVFFTNEDDALALSTGDRRYFVTWNDADPQPKAFYDGVWDWLRAGGIEAVGRWLMDRDVKGFNAKGRAPETDAKEAMRKETRPPLQEWIEDGISGGSYPFDRDLVIAEDVLKLTPEYARYKGQLPSPQRIAKALKRAGAACLTDQIRIAGVDGAKRIWAVRRTAMYFGQEDNVLRGLFVKQRDEVAGSVEAAFK